jgi:hypothetical protein
VIHVGLVGAGPWAALFTAHARHGIRPHTQHRLGTSSRGRGVGQVGRETVRGQVAHRLGVTDHEALEAPELAQHLGEQPVVAGRRDAVQVQVRGHDSAGAGVHRGFERRQVREIATYFVDNTAVPTITITSGRYVVAGNDAGRASNGVTGDSALGNAAAVPVTTIPTTGWTSSAWCATLYNPNGSQKTFKYSAQNGLQPGQCTSITAP